MSILWLDFETRSECDLPARGSYNYARHESTQVICMAWALDDEDVVVWTPEQPFPERVRDHDGLIYAHNAAFERLIFWHVLNIHFDLEQFYCTAAQARANCAPGSLEDVGRFAGADMRKDHKGKALVKKCCCPPFKHTEQDLLELYDYCAQDVRAMRAISKAMRPLSKQELADYHVNERINDRGVRVDVDLAAAAQWYSAQEVAELQARVAEATHGEVLTVRSPRLRTWVAERLGPEARKLMIVRRGEEDKESIDKSVRANLLALAEEDPDEVPADVAEVIQCADDLWASAVAKFARLRDLASPLDDRVRGAFVFAGGSATGRYSSYGAQVHNFPRKAAKDPAAVRDAMLRRHSLVPRHGPRVNDILKQMLRPALIPAPGRVFIVADWSAIEGRVHPWLANSLAGERKLQVFREGLDPYKVNAAATFHCTYEQVTDEQRQVGKVQELALGFLGGPGAFETFGRVYGVRLPPSEVTRAVEGWRRANPWAHAHGRELEQGYYTAMRCRGHAIKAARVAYLFDGVHLWYQLPSGRVLCYPYARVDDDGSISYAKAAWKPKADATEWPRGRLWPGLACENVTQATANDILRVSLRPLPEVVLHVHDELVLEVLESVADEAAARLREVMCAPPDWAGELPLNCEVKIMERYGK
jgi:DNA polymerase